MCVYVCVDTLQAFDAAAKVLKGEDHTMFNMSKSIQASRAVSTLAMTTRWSKKSKKRVALEMAIPRLVVRLWLL